MTAETAHVAPWKLEEVEELKELLEDSPVVAIAEVGGIPAAQMQEMRGSLRGDARIRVVKNTLLRRAMREVGRDGLPDLAEDVRGQTALITTDMNPFTLFKRLEDAKTRAPASGGEESPEDIVVEEGETPFSPGPVVGDLQNAGIPAAIEGGAVVVPTTEVVVEEGEEIPIETAQMLTRLEIYPITVGIDLRKAWEDGTIFDRSVLDVDEEAFLEDVRSGGATAFQLAVEIGWPTDETLPALLTRARGQAEALGLEAGLTEPGIVDRHLARAGGEALSLAGQLDADALDDDLRERLGIAPAEPEVEPEAEEDVDDEPGEEPGEEGEEPEEPAEDVDEEGEEPDEDVEEPGEDAGDEGEEPDEDVEEPGEDAGEEGQEPGEDADEEGSPEDAESDDAPEEAPGEGEASDDGGEPDEAGEADPDEAADADAGDAAEDEDDAGDDAPDETS